MHQINNSGPVPPFHAGVPAEHAAPAGWRIRYRQGATDCIEGFASWDAATEAACRLLDGGTEVTAIGAGPDEAVIDRERLALIYASWVRARYH